MAVPRHVDLPQDMHTLCVAVCTTGLGQRLDIVAVLTMLFHRTAGHHLGAVAPAPLTSMEMENRPRT